MERKQKVQWQTKHAARKYTVNWKKARKVFLVAGKNLQSYNKKYNAKNINLNAHNTCIKNLMFFKLKMEKNFVVENFDF